MRIGIDARLWRETGVGRYIRNLVANLHEIDKVNEYVLFMQARDFQQLTVNNSQLTRNKNWKIVPVDIRWHTAEEQAKFPQILNKESLDLMHFPYFSIPVNYKKPYVITIHDLILNHFPTGKASTLPLPIYNLKRFGYKYILANAIKNTKKIIVPLNAVKEDVLKLYVVSADKIIVTYEGVDPKVSSVEYKVLSKDDHNTKYFLYVGNAYPHKNLERLIEAFIMFHEKQKEVKLFLVGKDDFFYKRLERKVLDQGLENEIIFHHDVTDEELANFYNGALAFISPSLMEGFGLPALEAMSLGCMVLVSDIPSFKEVCQDVAIYFDSNSVEDIKNKMVDACAIDNKLKQQQIKRGLKRVKLFSWKLMTEQTLEVYDAINQS